jgi:hypothetical protein
MNISHGEQIEIRDKIIQELYKYCSEGYIK